MVIAYNNCGTDSATRLLEVSTTKMAPFFAFATPFGRSCPGDTVIINSNAGLKNHLINFGDGTLEVSNSMPVKHVYAQTGNYNITILGENFCGARDTAYITNYTISNTINPIVSWNHQPFNPCPNETITFSRFGNGIKKVTWKFGDGSTLVDSSLTPQTHSYPSIGTYTVTMIAENSCGNRDSSQRIVIVGNGSVPSAFFNTSASFRGQCYDTPVDFNSFVTNAAHYWEFGDGDTSHQESPSHTYSAPGTYIVTHTLTNFCGNTASRADEVLLTNFSNPNSTFSISPGTACPGDSIRLTIDPTTFAGSGHYFVMGNGDFVLSSQDTAWYIYPSGGNFKVELVDTNACGFSYDEDSVSISPLPATDFSFTPANPGVGDTVWFSLDSVGATFVDWEFDTLGNSSLLNPYFIFAEQGEFNISLRGFSNIGCECSSEETITVGPPEGLVENHRNWSIFPNPTEGVLCISTENGEAHNFVLSDLLGRSFSVNPTSEGTRTIIDLNSVPNGTYLLQFEVEGKPYVEKVVVLR